jgi:pimeloyl-ACP methyl ester carboxylesterase
VYVYDLLGFGASEKRDGQNVSIAGQGELLAQLVELWGLRSPSVVAHDIGGGIALRAHLLHGLRLHALTLVDVVAIGEWGSPFYRLVREHREVFEQLPSPIHEGVLRAYVNTAQARPLERATEDALITPWLGAEGQSAFYRQIAQGDQRHTLEVETRYGEINVPTLVVWGDSDPWLSPALGQELARRITGSRFQLVPNTGHLVQEEEPQRLAQLIKEHLEQAG